MRDTGLGPGFGRCYGVSIDFNLGLNQNTVVRRLAAFYSVGALLLALVYSPQFHLHEFGEHGEGAILHAHFPELEKFHHDAEPDVEPNDSHEKVRSIDLLTSTIISQTVQPFVISDAPAFVPKLEEQRPVSSVETPRTHDPPALDRSIPRSPPSD